MLRRRKSVLIGLGIVVFLVFSSSDGNLAEMQEVISTDYVILLDISATMYEEVLLIPSDFFLCEPTYVTREGEVRNLYEDAESNLRDTGEKSYAKRITIARGALECFMEEYGKKNDRITLLVVGDEGAVNITEGFLDYSEWPRILKVIEEEESKITGSTYSPLGDALWETVSLFHYESPRDRIKVMLFMSDLMDRPPPMGGKHLCEAAEEVFQVYHEEIRIESIFFLCIAADRANYEEKKNCFDIYMPSITMIPVSMETGFAIPAVKKIIDLQIDKRLLETETNEKERIIMSLRYRIEKYKEMLLEPSRTEFVLTFLKYPLMFILLVCGLGVLLGLRIIFVEY